MAAYRDLFGNDPEKRTPIQEIVWNDLQNVGYSKRPVFVPDREGRLCPMRAAFADGRRSVLLYIESNVSFVSEVQQPQ